MEYEKLTNSGKTSNTTRMLTGGFSEAADGRALIPDWRD